jgi:YcxB-like protein
MQIAYQIDETDFVSATRLAMRTRSKLARYKLYLFPLLGVFLIAVGVLAAIRRQDITGLWPVLMWGTILLCVPFLWNYQFRRVYRKIPLLRDRRTLDLESSHLSFRTETSDSRAPWSSYTKFAEDEKTFILFQQGNQIFIPIPKRVLSSSQIDEVRSIFESHLPRK